MQFKQTKKLFYGKYQYKIVLVFSGAHLFRGAPSDVIADRIKHVKLETDIYARKRWTIKTEEELKYAVKLEHALSNLENFELRVETPWVTIYTNNKKDVDKLTNLDKSRVKYICEPLKGTTLEENTVILPKIKYDYRVTLGKTSQEYSTFITWANTNSKIKLTKSCKTELLKNTSWGGCYFYITGDNNLLMAKMHLCGAISKVERVVNEKA
jgi:hypothetical protein